MNNFEKIKRFISNTNGYSNEKFYYIEIIQRRKENTFMDKGGRLIKSYQINSEEDLIYFQEEIKTLCKVFNARAYINLNPKSYRKLAFNFSKKLISLMDGKHYKSIIRKYNSCIMKQPGFGEKIWFIDLDPEDLGLITIFKYIDIIKGFTQILEILPTPNGYHILIVPFNTKLIPKDYNYLDIKKNDFNLLYYNNGNS